MRTVAFVPMKLNNERLPGKNTLPFDGSRPLFHSIVNSLTGVSEIDEVFIYCSDDSVAEYLPAGAKFLTRDVGLDRSSTRINEVIESFAHDVDADVYVLAHATAPFLSSASISRLIAPVLDGRNDSALTVVAMREFFWRRGAPFNYDPTDIPRTQDLEPLLAETSGAWAFGRDLARSGRRVGEQPALVEVDPIEAIDINEAVDFEIAWAVQRARDSRS